MNKAPDKQAGKREIGGRRTAIAGRWWLGLLLLALAAAGIYLYLTSGKIQHPSEPRAEASGRRAQTPGPARPMPVVAAAARTGDIDVYLGGLGSVLPFNTVTVRTRVDGQLVKVLFKEGQIVQRGDLLAEIDPRPFQVQLLQAQGQLARDRALLENARVDLDRYRTLYQQDSIAKQQLDTQYSLVRQYEGAIETDRGQIENARLQLVYAKITAPITGRIGLRLVDEGNIVHATDTNGLVVITQLQPVSMVFTLPEDSIPVVMQKLRAGEKLRVDAYDRAQKNLLANGYLMTVDNQIDPTTGTVKLKARFENEDFRLFPNQFVNARLLIEIRHGATIVPTPAVQRGSQGAFVYVVKEDRTVAIRPVTTGTVEGDSTEIASGLASGELVVTDGADKLREGAKVEVTMADGKARNAAGAQAQSQPQSQPQQRGNEGAAGAPRLR